MGDLLPCPHLTDKSRAFRGDHRVNVTFPILSWGLRGARGVKKIKCNSWLSPASGQKAKCKEVGESTAGPLGQLEGPAASPMVLSARISSRSSRCLESLVMCCTQEGLAAFVALTKQCSSHSSKEQQSLSYLPNFSPRTDIRKKSDCAKQRWYEEVGPAMPWCRSILAGTR